jgi:hypothetical protein
VPKLKIANLKVVINFFLCCLVSTVRYFDSIRGKFRTEAEIVVGTVVVGQEVHRVVWHDVFGMFVHEVWIRGKGMGGRESELVSLPR